MDSFKADTGATVDQFLARKILLPHCLDTLAYAFIKVKPKPKFSPSRYQGAFVLGEKQAMIGYILTELSSHCTVSLLPSALPLRYTTVPVWEKSNCAYPSVGKQEICSSAGAGVPQRCRLGVRRCLS